MRRPQAVMNTSDQAPQQPAFFICQKWTVIVVNSISALAAAVYLLIVMFLAVLSARSGFGSVVSGRKDCFCC